MDKDKNVDWLLGRVEAFQEDTEWYQMVVTNSIPDLANLPEHGDHMTIEKFRASCGRAFVSSDGYGQLATATKISYHDFYVSDVYSDKPIPEWATHIVWYNN